MSCECPKHFLRVPRVSKQKTLRKSLDLSVGHMSGEKRREVLDIVTWAPMKCLCYIGRRDQTLSLKPWPLGQLLGVGAALYSKELIDDILWRIALSECEWWKAVDAFLWRSWFFSNWLRIWSVMEKMHCDLTGMLEILPMLWENPKPSRKFCNVALFLTELMFYNAMAN